MREEGTELGVHILVLYVTSSLGGPFPARLTVYAITVYAVSANNPVTSNCTRSLASKGVLFKVLVSWGPVI